MIDRESCSRELAVLAAVGVAQPAAAGFVETHSRACYATATAISCIHSHCRLHNAIVVGHGGGDILQQAGGPRASPRVVYLDDEMYRVPANVYALRGASRRRVHGPQLHVTACPQMAPCAVIAGPLRPFANGSSICSHLVKGIGKGKGRPP